MCVKNAKKASSKLQKMQTTLSRNCCSKDASKKTQQSKFEKLHPQSVKTGSNEKAPFKLNSFLTQGT